MAYLNLAAVRQCTEAEGPGRRFALWCQGCRQRCPGCCNELMQPLERRHIVKVEDLAALIAKSQSENQLEGVSFIGGEPFLQAAALAELAEWCQGQGLSVLVFTGYQYEQLKKSREAGTKKLLANTDILIDGPFVQELYDEERDWIGSTNQRAIFLTDRYPPGIELEKRARRMDIAISDDRIDINGWPF